MRKASLEEQLLAWERKFKALEDNHDYMYNREFETLESTIETLESTIEELKIKIRALEGKIDVAPSPLVQTHQGAEPEGESPRV